MPKLSAEAVDFRCRARAFEQEARQTAAFFLVSRIDLAAALAATGAERARVELRIARLLERERIKGMRRHWSYDLNRHIALKQALDRLRGVGGDRVFAAVFRSTRPFALKRNMAPEGAM